MGINQKIINVIVILFLGFTFGYFFNGWYSSLNSSRHHERRRGDREAMFSRFAEDLDLNESQQGNIRNILKNQKEKLDSIHEVIKPKFDKVISETRIEINEQLNPEQKKLFVENHQKFGVPPHKPKRHDRGKRKKGSH